MRFHDPHVASFRDASGTVRTGVGLDGLLTWADVMVVVTPHRAVDWDLVYGSAELVVDTVNSSKDRPLRARQVLRLGAGWSSAA